jgi:hypothetical protein
VEPRLPVPPFTEQSARQKVQAAEDAWNTCDPDRVASAYTLDSVWRNRAEFFEGREAIVDFLRRKWSKELDYSLRKELWALLATASRYALSTRAMIKAGSGGAATATNTGSSTTSDICAAETPVSTTIGSMLRSGGYRSTAPRRRQRPKAR